MCLLKLGVGWRGVGFFGGTPEVDERAYRYIEGAVREFAEFDCLLQDLECRAAYFDGCFEGVAVYFADFGIFFVVAHEVVDVSHSLQRQLDGGFGGLGIGCDCEDAGEGSHQYVIAAVSFGWGLWAQQQREDHKQGDGDCGCNSTIIHVHGKTFQCLYIDN